MRLRFTVLGAGRRTALCLGYRDGIDFRQHGYACAETGVSDKQSRHNNMALAPQQCSFASRVPDKQTICQVHADGRIAVRHLLSARRMPQCVLNSVLIARTAYPPAHARGVRLRSTGLVACFQSPTRQDVSAVSYKEGGFAISGTMTAYTCSPPPRGYLLLAIWPFCIQQKVGAS